MYVKYMYLQFVVPKFDRLVKKPWEENYSLNDVFNGRHSRAQNNSFLVPHEEVLGSNLRRSDRKKLIQGIF